MDECWVDDVVWCAPDRVPLHFEERPLTVNETRIDRHTGNDFISKIDASRDRS